MAKDKTDTTTDETVVETPAAVAPPPAEDAVEETADDRSKKRWRRTLIIVGNHRIPDDGRAVIVTEERAISGEVNTPSFKAELKTEGYPAKADLYYRTDTAVTFPDGAEVVTLGRTVAQVAFWGLSSDPRGINVGPSSPAYGALNLAFLRGAEEVEIVGLSNFEKEQLRPFLDKLEEGGPPPYSDNTPDIRAPASVKVTLA